MDNPLHWIIDYFAAEPVRVSAILRLPLIALIAVLVWIWEVDHWLPQLYAVILGVYAVAAVLWLVAVLRGPMPRWADWASTAVDLLVIIGLCLVSGGATAALLAQLGLTPAVRELVKQFETRTETAVEAELEDVGKPESQQLLHRAARELLTNVGKHAGATTVRVGLKRKGNRVILTIADDGRGFDPAVVSQYVADGHIGLGSLLARFDAIGGAMEIDSRVGHGTQVKVTSPPEPASVPSIRAQ